MQIKEFHDADTGTFTYVVSDPESNFCAIIDPVMNYDPLLARLTLESAEQVIQFIEKNELKVAWILETHIHADHMSAAGYLKNKLGGQIAISARIKEVLNYWIPVFDEADTMPANGGQFDQLFSDGWRFDIGALQGRVIETPGHTPVCLAYHIGDALFVGDALLNPEIGTARADFPGGNPMTLYHSIQRLYKLPDETRVYTGHDYPKEGKAPKSQSTIGIHKKKNKMCKADTSEEEFVKARTTRDKTLGMPKLMLQSVQVNLRGGRVAPVRENKVSYLTIPLNVLRLAGE